MFSSTDLAFISSSLHPQVRPPTFFAQIANSFFEEVPEESPWLGFGPGEGNPPLKLSRGEKGELGRLALTGTQMRVGGV